MKFGELETYRVLLGNHISLLPRVVLLIPRSYLEMIVAVSVMCPAGLCVVFFGLDALKLTIFLGDTSGRIEAHIDAKISA